jgi:hypothetical protein
MKEYKFKAPIEALDETFDSLLTDKEYLLKILYEISEAYVVDEDPEEMYNLALKGLEEFGREAAPDPYE